jgi:phospholipid-binding lipoprotein MlaA
LGLSTFTVSVLLASAPVSPSVISPAVSGPIAALAADDHGARAPAIPADRLAIPAKLPPLTDPALSTPSQTIGQNEIVVSARRPTPGDPLGKLNAKTFAATQAVDEAVVGPIALGYKNALPAPVRSGFRNFLNNLHEPDVFFNFLLQLKPGKAAETFGRFAANSTIGVAGLFDVAKRPPFNLPRRANGFADSLGYYGVKTGPFLFLPLVGPTTPRDLAGLILDRLLLPVAIGNPFNQLAYTVPTGVISTLDHRAEFDEELHKLREGTADPYAARRDFYLQGRQAEIDELRGKHSGRD